MRGLVIIRAGSTSLHGHFVAGRQDWDFALSVFGDHPLAGAEDAQFIHRHPGPKYRALADCVVQFADVILRYDQVWFPDDDILCTHADVSQLFAYGRSYQLELAQPSLSHDSYWSHAITLHHAGWMLRFTNFVEVMMPLMSTAFLRRVSGYFDEAMSGWGLDYLLARRSALGKVAVIDAIQVTHTRPIGGGSIYQFNTAAGVAPYVEAARFAARYFLEPSPSVLCFGGRLDDGRLSLYSPQPERTGAFLQALAAGLQGVTAHPAKVSAYRAAHARYAEVTDLAACEHCLLGTLGTLGTI